jgi:citrate lyase subunit beta / citryl-CoA lyase
VAEEQIGSGRRSVLSVPASEARMIAKALRAGADEVVLDLEDAVAPDRKDHARGVLATFPWEDHGDDLPLLAVRVNAPRTPWCHRDIEAVAGAQIPVASLVLPKVESRADVGFVERLLDGVEEAGSRPLAVQALVETARGLAWLDDVVSDVERLSSLILGYADLAASLGRGPGFPADAWLVAQERVLTAARSANLEAVDGPHLGVAADEAFSTAVERSAALGFDAKWAIHPRQVPALNAAFQPSAEEIAGAHAVLRVLEEGHRAGRGAVRLEGDLVDEAMAVGARRVLAKARA